MINYEAYEIYRTGSARSLIDTKQIILYIAAFGAEPNSHISPITLGHPGTVVLNRGQLSCKQDGLACNCEIERVNYFARKLFLSRFAQGYQISNIPHPYVKAVLKIRTAEGERQIELNRIHLKKTAKAYMILIRKIPVLTITGPSCARGNCNGTMVRNSEEAYSYLTELQTPSFLKFATVIWKKEVCDAMNVSIRKRRNKTRTKVEVKNLNLSAM